MTGKHPGHAFIHNNGEIKPEGQRPIPLNEITLAEILKKEGYVTGVLESGLGGPGTKGDPMNQGFDRFLVITARGMLIVTTQIIYGVTAIGFLYRITHLFLDMPRLQKELILQDPKSYEIFKGADYASDRINEQALEFIIKNKDKPFFLYYPTLIPHVALHVPDEELKPYLELRWNDPRFTEVPRLWLHSAFHSSCCLCGMITRMDRYVGRVINLIKETGRPMTPL